MTKRKTMSVDDIRVHLNTYLRNTDGNALKGSTCYTAEQWKHMRLGACSLLEDVLHVTGNYRGYTYVTDYTVDESSRHYN